MYSRYYGFAEKPFDITPDPKFLYLSPSHREVLASLVYGIKERRGFIAILGEAGTGKTTLLRSALDHLKEDVKVAYIFNTDITFDEMFQMILEGLGLASRKERLPKVEAFHRLNDFTIRQLSAGGNVVIMVDEAQNLDRNCLENLRLLSNLETRRHKLIQIVLSGQPELEEKLRLPDLRQLSQRINLKRYILPLSKAETHEFIEQRLKVVRYSGPSLFTKEAEKLLWEASGGIPRIINTLCDNALLIAFGLRARSIQEECMKEAIDDLSREGYRELSERRAGPIHSLDVVGGPLAARRAWGALGLLVVISCVGLFAGAVGGLFGNEWKARVGVPAKETVGALVAFDIPKHLGKSEATSHPQTPSPLAPADDTPVTVLSTSRPDELLHTELQEAASHEISGKESAESPEDAPSAPAVEEVTDVSARQGDTLHSIIVRFYGIHNKTLEQSVLRANPEIKDPNRIFVSQRIRMPDRTKEEHKTRG